MCISRFLFFVMQELLVQHSTILILWTDTQLTASYYRPVLAWPPAQYILKALSDDILSSLVITMKPLAVVNLLLLICMGYALKIPEFLEQFDDTHVNERQTSTDVSDKIVPVFTIAFFASMVNSLLFRNSAPATTRGQYEKCSPMFNIFNIYCRL